MKSQRFRRSKKNDLLAFLEEVVKHGITAGMLHIHSFISIPAIRDDYKIRFLFLWLLKMPLNLAIPIPK